jgi:hypothetical protein
LAELVPRNRLLGSLKVENFGLCPPFKFGGHFRT